MRIDLRWDLRLPPITDIARRLSIVRSETGGDIGRRIPCEHVDIFERAVPGDRIDFDVFLERNGSKFIVPTDGPGGHTVARGRVRATVGAVEFVS